MDNPLGNRNLSNTYLQQQNYKLIQRLGMGAFGEIYLAQNKQKEEFAIKLERTNCQYPQILYEAKVYAFLHQDTQQLDKGIPKVFGAATEGDYNYLVMELLGSSIEDLFAQCHRKLSIKTVCMLAEQMVSRLELMHSRSFIHRDVKPDNFLMGIGKKQSKLYVVDMGLAKRYLTKDGHIPFKENKPLTGTARYASINTHLGYEQSRRDDLEGLAYVLVYLAKGTLPWMNLACNNKNDKYVLIKEKKIKTTTEQLCSGLPEEMTQYLNYVKKLKFEEKPDYNYLRNLFKQALQRQNLQLDYIYDWTKPEKKRQENDQVDAIRKVKEEIANKEQDPKIKQIPQQPQQNPAKAQSIIAPKPLPINSPKGNQKIQQQQIRPQSAQKPVVPKRPQLPTQQGKKPPVEPRVAAPRIVINKEPYTKY
ncbi:unnamed protein product (macronuclear) [Paramecium tetraurelia]|uniref:Casein kinase I n=1 Tax=Paramecium tetraurelia TaxID=5888 RepID=A0BTC3_PARTE|nr:uncharacterized protein GSPATT00032022001 [Paramecium tetraurelia]CAK61790.1 unnamed protein product [Paramecium tetraurelia]|eukprot:XP_001429188.1 hypothetical protein (macronuclear) [Paramecium tetraurelia strain d4-2]